MSNFDNIIALISWGYPSDLEQKNDLFIHDFQDLLNVEKIDCRIPELDEGFMVSFILNGYWLLINMKI